jgi:hypothetical protein
MSMESVKNGYEKTRNRYSGATANERNTYDFNRLLDATWNLKVAMELFSSRNHRLGNLMKHDLFYLVIVCSRLLDDTIRLRTTSANFLDCWATFRKIIEQKSTKAEDLSDDLALALVRILFIAALIFKMPDLINVGNILSNSNTRRANDTFPASTDDIEFAKTLPADLNGPFASFSDILISLRKNLDYYLEKTERQ